MIHTSIKNHVACLHIQNPQKLNALGTSDYQLILKNLKSWKTDPNIKAVIFLGEKKAFCAGGDVKSLCDKSFEERRSFFTWEYSVDHFIHNYSKPIVALTEGIVMGGGLGFINGCSHRVVSESVRLAMPEVLIGFFPDVGASHFLNKVSPSLGCFLALTGVSFSYEEALFLNIADHFISSSEFKNIQEELFSLEWSEDPKEHYEQITKLLLKKTEKTKGVESWVKAAESCIDLDSLEETDRRLKSCSKELSVIENYNYASSLAKSIVFEQMKRFRGLDIKSTFEKELSLAFHFAEGEEFFEGINALLVRKDRKPSWKYLDMNIPKEEVESYFKEKEEFKKYVEALSLI